MNILYTSRGIPLLEVDGEIYDFSGKNMSLLIGELSTEPEKCTEILEKVLSTVQETMNSYSLTVNSTGNQINTFLTRLSELTEFYVVVDAVEQALNNHRMLTTPKPHDKWIWNGELQQWVAPIEYPSQEGDGIYIWSDDEATWLPVEPRPHPSWVWDANTLEYIPPIPYPLDAQEGDFVWNEERMAWALNV